jgi:hypothetical protein
MLRSVAKVMVNGNPAGMVVLNANADELEKRLRTVLPTAVAQPVVLNSSGGWIMGGGEKDWLFSAKPDAPDALLSTQSPRCGKKSRPVRQVNLSIVGMPLLRLVPIQAATMAGTALAGSSALCRSSLRTLDRFGS